MTNTERETITVSMSIDVEMFKNNYDDCKVKNSIDTLFKLKTIETLMFILQGYYLNKCNQEIFKEDFLLFDFPYLESLNFDKEKGYSRSRSLVFTNNKVELSDEKIKAIKYIVKLFGKYDFCTLKDKILKPELNELTEISFQKLIVYIQEKVVYPKENIKTFFNDKFHFILSDNIEKNDNKLKKLIYK